MMESRETMKKVVIFTAKGCYRSTCNHPFFVCMLCFLVLLYRSFPFLFSLLVSSSPVIVCTGILLGTLLSFGKPNIPEIVREERATHEAVSSESNLVFDRNASVSVERYGDRGKSVVGALIRESSSVENEISRADSDGGFGNVLEKMSKEMEFDDMDREERRREYADLELESKSEMFGERIGDITIVENHYSLIPEVDDEHIDLENDRSPTFSVDSKMVNVDCLDSPPCTPWRHVNQEDEEENEDDETLDSGSDRAESSSPDASLADILPVLDELHPLLDEDSSHRPHPVNLSHDGSDASSEQSARTDESSNESDDDTETQVSEVAENGNEHGEGDDELETHQEEEDQTKSAISWTEEDERNLMDLGSSELERNQRLENLIARRRARKTMSVVPEANLIDLESTTDFTFSVPPILTTRHNPFDVSQNSYEDMGLPPIPGSAPSVLLHRRNPFDIPYDSSEEKPDLMEDSFQQEFTPSQSKDHFFRRHESFNTWRTPFGISRSEKQDMSRFRPFFVEERLGLEGTSFSPFQRQLSEISDSKASSVPDTGSVSSSESSEKWDATEEETFPIEDGNNIEDDITRELDLITRTELASELAGHGSESSEEENSMLSQMEVIPMKDEAIERKLEETGYHQEPESSLVVEKGLANQSKTSLTESYSNVEAHEQRYKTSSSSSSLSEESERIYVEKEVEDFPSFIDETFHLEDRSVSAQPSLQGSHLSITAPLRADAFRDPVYDLSPSSVKKRRSRSSNGSEIDIESVGIKKSVSFSEKVIMIGSQEMESDAIVDKETSTGSSDSIQVEGSQMASSSDVQITTPGDRRNVNELICEGDIQTTEPNDINYDYSEDSKISASPLTSEVAETEIISGYMEITDHNDLRYDLSESHKNSASAASAVVPETVLDHIEQSSMGSLLDLVHEDVTSPHSSSVGTDTDVIKSLSMPLNELNLSGSVELDSADIQEMQSIADHTTQEESILSEETLFQSSFDGPDHEDKRLTSPRRQFLSAESPRSLPVEEMAPSRNSFYESYVEDHKDAQKSEISVVESLMEASTTDSWSNYNIPQIDNKLSLDIEVPTSPEFTAAPAEVFGLQSVEELDEIKEIDEHILEELDAVGDFRVKEFRGFDDPVVDADELGMTIKEFDQYDEDTEHVSELERSVIDPIDHLQYDRFPLDDSGHLETTEDNFYLKAEQTDFEVKSLAEISDIEENESVMAEIEAHFAKTIEAMIIKAESSSAKTGVLHLDPSPSFIDLTLEEYSTAGSDSLTTDKALGEANIHEEAQDNRDLDINQPTNQNLKQVLGSGSVQSSDGAKDIEGTFPELLVLKTQSLDDSDSALKQESRTSSSEALGFSGVLTAEDVRADSHSPKESKSGADEVKRVKHSLVGSDIAEVITPEREDVLISERKSLDYSFTDPKQGSHSSPREALKMSEDVHPDMVSPRESKSGAKESDMMKTLQHSLEESDIVEAKTSESDDGLISVTISLDDSFSDPKQKSYSSPREAVKMPEDVQADLDSPRESKSYSEESDVTKTLKHSLEESNIVEAKTPESDDVPISDITSLDDSFSDPMLESYSSPREALKNPEDVRTESDYSRESKSGVEESDVIKTLQHSDKVEAKTSESDDVILSERKSLDDSFSALKQESQSSPHEALEKSENVPAIINSPHEAISGAEDSDVKISQQNSLEEQKLSESRDVLISERHSPIDSNSTSKIESHSSPSKASKLPEDESAANVRSNIDSPNEANPGNEEYDGDNNIKKTDKKS